MKLINIILLVTAFISPLKTSWYFILFFLIIEGYLILISLVKSQHQFVSSAHFSNDEKRIFKKYYLYFKYPLASKSLSTSLSLIALSALILTPWFLYNSLWIQATLIGLNYFLAQFFSTKLNIRFYLHDAVERLKQEELRQDMILVDSVCEKILSSK